jgi:formylglycine-generating enzyme required for sulfatase activity
MLANIQYENMTAGLSAVLSPAFVSRLKKYVQPIASAVIEPAFGLPMLEWCDILGGKVIIEHILYEVETFRIAKYPVTNAQFQVFINDAKGYLDQAWWEFSEAARSWKGQHPMPAESTFKGDKLPRENVCWYEAMAFCNWLSAKNGLRITLPTEAQWQRAAHGDHEDPLPWGRVFEETKSNTAHSGINQTTPVDRYPQGASPYLVMDMNGNVWQWCLSEKEHPDKASVYSANGRVMRGGSWCESWVVIENTYRNPIAPDVRASNRGFRIACNPVPLP